MLPGPAGASAPLSSSTQATIKKHLPKVLSQDLNRGLLRLPVNVHKEDFHYLTDYSSEENLCVLEIFPLVEEHMPHYTLRSKFPNDYDEYPNKIISAPALIIPENGLGLTKDQIRETLNYFLLCGNRVSQMTRAYNDIEAVTRLLEEKEKDLELTVQIGKELLNQNNKLEIKITNLEADLKACYDDRSQLLHDLQKKTELIEILTSDTYHGYEGDTPTSSKSLSLDFLQRKISLLQEENQSLKVETMQLVFKTDEIEDHERKLMSDITTQLNETNSQFQDLRLELEQQREENRLQHEQILDLSSRLAETEMQLYETNSSYDELLALLNVTKESQNSLALELMELKQRYQEVLLLLQETQQALRKQQKQVISQSRNSFIPTNSFLNPESLHSELMDVSLFSENSHDSGISNDCYHFNESAIPNAKGLSSANNFESAVSIEASLYKKIFDTVYCGNKNIDLSDVRNRTIQTISTMSCSTSTSSIMSSMPYSNRISTINNDINHISNMLYKNSNESNEMNSETLSFPNSSSRSDDTYSLLATGIPGAPGAKDLEMALRRLTDTEVLSGRTMFSYTSRGACSSDENVNLMRSLEIRTPDSTELSLNTSYSLQHWRVPDKLQIVKPIEGSQTLNHWSKLATPTLSGLLEERPGVKIRGGRDLDDLGIRIYTLSDVEEDVCEEFPGKQFEPQNCIYTYITSTVMHPDDASINDPSISQIPSRVASTSTSKHPSGPSTPQGCLSRKNSCSTFSINVGLAAMLNERGIRAVTPAALNTPNNQNFSSTVTPRNSPDGSLKPLLPGATLGFLSSGMEIVRRTTGLSGVADHLNRQLKADKKIKLSGFEKRALKSLKLVEKVENIGLENIISPQQKNSQLPRISGAIERGAYLKPSNNFEGISDKISLEEWQKKCILSKGSSSAAQSSCSSNASGVFDANISDTKKDTLTNAANKSASQSNSKMLPYNAGKSNKGLRYKSVIANSIRNDLGKVEIKAEPLSQRNIYTNRSSNDRAMHDEQQNVAQSFVGSINSLLFGRKGGWL